MTSGLIFNIQKYSLHDGPGIRTTVFLKGCPLCCAWCHNPEGILHRCEIVVVENRCAVCGECRQVCPFAESIGGEGVLPARNEQCIQCGACVEACPTGARQMIGRTMSVPDVMREILKDRIFYDGSGGGVTGAMPDGRKAGLPLSEGISPVQGADRHGPTAVIKSAAKMDHVKTGGTLLNMKFTPGLVATDDSLDKWAHLVRGYFKMDGHHVQFNVTTADTLRKAQAHPEQHRDLIVRVAGYSDYFCDLSKELQEEIIARTEHHEF